MTKKNKLHKRRSRQNQQMFLDQRIAKQFKEFGGSLLKKSNAKKARPISTKHAMHVVLRSSLAVKSLSFRHQKNRERIEKLIRKQAKHFYIRIYEYANVGNHIHLLIKIDVRHMFSHFLRAITGLIARIALGAERGTPANNVLKFWDHRPYTRIVDWKKGYLIVKDYVIKNHLEAIGMIPHVRPVMYNSSA